MMGWILLIVGGIMGIMGYSDNHNDAKVMQDLLGGGDGNPGTMTMIIGVILVVVGIYLISKKNAPADKNDGNNAAQ